MNRTDEDFLNKFREGPQNIVNGTDDFIRTPMTRRSLNKSQYQMLSLKNKKGKKKRKKRSSDDVPELSHKKEKFSIFEKTLNAGNDGIFGHIINAIIGAIILFIVTSSPVKSVLAQFIPGFFKSCENKYMMNNGMYDSGPLPGTVIIKSSDVVSLKGKVIMMGIFIVLFVILKMWFITE